MNAHEISYADCRFKAENVWWKRLLDVQRPFRMHLRRLNLGRVLEVGCGIGRNLAHLRGTSIGVDRDPRAVEIARGQGLPAFTPEELRSSQWAVPGRFDCLLFSHVLEHMTGAEATALIREHLD